MKTLLILLLLTAPARADRADDLALAMHETWPREVSLNFAHKVAEAAVANATPLLTDTLLIGLASVESNFDPYARNGWAVCGISQANAGTRAKCLRLRDPGASFAKTVTQITRRLLANGSIVEHALSGYGCGGPDTRTKPCKYRPEDGGWYHERVFKRQRMLELQLARVPTQPGS